MMKQEFLQRLNRLLADVTQEEREEALRYYEEYFDEAGPEQEQAVLAELGSPEKVAATIPAPTSATITVSSPASARNRPRFPPK